mmetsp:Transcript_32517/g.92212  ORF Transcript_32517/g.92212 Transcript_32517/m.92212 type:complete len:287 (-) Transcript_32517:257-1117(-)
MAVGDIAADVEGFTSRLRQMVGLQGDPEPTAEEVADSIRLLLNPRAGFNRLLPQDRPRCVPLQPPKDAHTMYKVVALVDGIALSIYDGVTQYMPGLTWYQEATSNHMSGMYVYPSYQQCLQRDAEVFPAESALLDAPRGIAKVLCWMQPTWKLPCRYGTKTAYSYLRTVSVKPYPESWYHSTLCTNPPPGTDLQEVSHQASGAVRSTGPRAPTANESSRLAYSARPTRRTGLRPAAPGSDSAVSQPALLARERAESLIRRQATTMSLEDEIAEMEAQLERMRGVAT